MNIRTLTSVTASLLVISGVVSANLWRDLSAEREVSAALRGELATSAARAEAAPTAPVRVTKSTPAPALVLREQPGAPGARSAPGADPSRIFGGVRVSERELLQDPEYRKARLKSLQYTMALSYPGLAYELGLSKAQSDQFFDLLARNRLELDSQLATLPTGNEQADRAAEAEAARLRQATQRQLSDSLRDWLGDARFAQWQDYQRTRQLRIQAGAYADVLAQAGVPLDSTQYESLVTSMTSEQSSQKMLDAASVALSPQQIRILRTQFEQQDAYNRAEVRALARLKAGQSQQ